MALRALSTLAASSNTMKPKLGTCCKERKWFTILDGFGCTLEWVVGISRFATFKIANFSESYETFVLFILLRTHIFSPKNGFVLFEPESSGGLIFHEKEVICRHFIHNS